MGKGIHGKDSATGLCTSWDSGVEQLQKTHNAGWASAQLNCLSYVLNELWLPTEISPGKQG